MASRRSRGGNGSQSDAVADRTPHYLIARVQREENRAAGGRLSPGDSLTVVAADVTGGGPYAAMDAAVNALPESERTAEFAVVLGRYIKTAPYETVTETRTRRGGTQADDEPALAPAEAVSDPS